MNNFRKNSDSPSEGDSQDPPVLEKKEVTSKPSEDEAKQEEGAEIENSPLSVRIKTMDDTEK